MKFCRRCHKTLPDAAFSTVVAKQKQVCADCIRKRSSYDYRQGKQSDPLGFWAAKTARNIKARCKKINRGFSLVIADLMRRWDEQGGRCYYCSRQLELFKEQGGNDGLGGRRVGIIRQESASVDRVVNEKGYTADNVVLACARCNQLKSTSSPDDLKMLADGVARFLSGKH